jgi:hypothetical protein
MNPKPPPLPVTARPRRVKTVLALIISAIACVALGMKLNRLRESIMPDASPIPRADEARQLPTAPATGVPMIRTAKGDMVSLRPISVGEFAAFADETGLPESTYAWVKYNWGWEWKKGYSWRYSGETRGQGDSVTAISLQDAQAFCRWLTDKQRAQGSLATGQFYRVAEGDERALTLAVHGARQSSVRGPDANMAPGFHIELAQVGAPGDI